MNFLNGMWLTRAGCRIEKAMQAYDAAFDGTVLRIVAPTRFIRDRGDTLNLPVLTIEFFSPREDIVSCRITHHKGVHPLHAAFETFPDAVTPVFQEYEDRYEFISGNTRAVISRSGGWQVDYYYKDRFLTASTDNSPAHITLDGKRYLREMLDLSVGETIYGLGERFTAFVKNGQKVVCRNEDGGTCTPQAYKNVPFCLSSQGYGLLVDTPATVEFEIGSEVVSKLQFSAEEQSLCYHIIGGEDMKSALITYTGFTGRPAMLPPWSFGLWLSTSFTTNYDEETTSSMINGMRDRHIPLDVFHYDCFWMKGFQWCNFLFDDATFPDPKGMLVRNHQRGLKNCVWINPYIAQLSPLFDEAAQGGYLLKRENGDIWQWDLWQAGMGIVDFTNPDARTWYQEKLSALLDMGVDCFKTDFGERIPTDVVYWNHADPQRMHNLYTFLYNKTVFELLEQKKGHGQAVLFARSATAGSQRFPLHWGGDCNGTFSSMAETLRGGLSLGMCGFGFWSHDIGGFETEASPDVFKRWIAFGLMSSHSRLHGSKGYRVPWVYDEESVDVLRFFTDLKLSLMPYLYSVAEEAHRTGLPMMRSMALEFSHDLTCRWLDTQYMLGDKLLVAPVFSESGQVSFYLPEGEWTNYLTGETLSGGWHQDRCGYLDLPLYVRPNSLLPYTSSRPFSAEYDYLDRLCYRLYAPQEGVPAKATVWRSDLSESQTVQAVLKDGQVHFTISGAQSPITLLCGDKRISIPAGETQADLAL